MSGTIRTLATLVVVATALSSWPAHAAAQGTTYRGYASPQQESGPPSGSPATAVGTMDFDPYLTEARINFKLAGLEPSLITAFHIHCGVPGQLGPIIVDFSRFGPFTETFKHGELNVVVHNQDIVVATWPPAQQQLPLPEGCPSGLFLPGQSNTVAGLEALSRLGVLYFNLHIGSNPEPTYFFGLIRGQIYPAPPPNPVDR